MNNKGPLIYSGRASISLSKSVAKHLGIELGKLRIRIFADSEPWFCIYDYDRIDQNTTVYIIQSTSEYAPTSYFDLFGILAAVKRQKPKRIVVIMTFMGFRRQERAILPGEAIMAEQMAALIAAAGATDVVLCDPHAPAIIAAFQDHRIRVHVIDPNPIFAAVFQGWDLSNYAVLDPDKGRLEAARQLAVLLGIPLVSVIKSRPEKDQSQCEGIQGGQSVEGMHLIMREDEVGTGGTALNTVKEVVAKGALDVTIMETHSVCVGDSVWNIVAAPEIVGMYTTDSIYIPWEKRDDKIHILPLAPSIADVIKRIEEE